MSPIFGVWYKNEEIAPLIKLLDFLINQNYARKRFCIFKLFVSKCPNFGSILPNITYILPDITNILPNIT